MNYLIESHVAVPPPSTRGKKRLAVLALGILATALVGSIAPAAAKAGSRGTQSLTPLPPVVRDHRTGPIVRDARTGTVTRDHRGGGSVVVTGGRTRKVPCLGNLCHVKVCAASVCF